MNDNLNAAKTAKNDEFYTQYEDIEREVAVYVAYDPDVFRGKTVLLPCDDPERSNFTRYFNDHFEEYGIRRLVSTCIAPQARLKSPLFDGIGHGRCLVRTRGKGTSTGILDDNGDFRSKELCQLRDEADMIVTNPPFSLFREFVAWIGDKRFLVIGNMNATTYKEVFPLIKENKVWLGVHNGAKDYEMPSGENRKFGNTCWFTNLEHGHRHEPLRLMTMSENEAHSRHEEVREHGYRHYDNYDAIEVPFTDAIPSDYDGVMGVPISFLDKYCPEQFEIVGNEYSLKMDKGRGYIDGKRMYSRIFIRHKQQTAAS